MAWKLAAPLAGLGGGHSGLQGGLTSSWKSKTRYGCHVGMAKSWGNRIECAHHCSWPSPKKIGTLIGVGGVPAVSARKRSFRSKRPLPATWLSPGSVWRRTAVPPSRPIFTIDAPGFGGSGGSSCIPLYSWKKEHGAVVQSDAKVQASSGGAGRNARIWVLPTSASPPEVVAVLMPVAPAAACATLYPAMVWPAPGGAAGVSQS